MATQDTPPPLPHPHRSVLIGTSLGEESDQVVRAGLAVARAAGAQVHFVHAVPEEPRLAGPESGLSEDLNGELAAWCERRLGEQVERLGIGRAELAAAEVLPGAPHRVLINAAAGADLIVVGATGAGPLAAEHLGSTADRVLRKASCPVLLVRGELRVPPARVLAPVDLSPLSAELFRRGLQLLGQLAQQGGIGLRALYVARFLREPSFAEAQRQLGEELGRFVRDNGAGPPFTVETAVLLGEPWFEILRELGERPADLVLLGTHGRGGLDRLMMGSVAAAVARRAPGSVLLISPAPE
jgi:nucleotide-binding universal stress UspA family protein